MAQPKSEVTAPAIPTARRYPKILIVEDESITAHHLRQSLTKFGYEVVGVAATGESALRQAEESCPDLLLADIGLQGKIDGIEVAAKARALWQIPTVFLTAYTDPETMRRSRGTEPYGYLIKPFAEDELHATLEIALQQKSLHEERNRKNLGDLGLLERTKEELYDLAAKLVSAQEEERERVARDLHDDLSQRLAFLQFGMDRVVQQLASVCPGQLLAELRKFVSDLDGISEDVRRISHGLHPSILEHIGLAAALRELAQEFQKRESIRARCSVRHLPPRLIRNVNISIYRIVQEALRNVAKHSGAKSVDIALIHVADELQLSIRDSGRGFNPEQAKAPGLGLTSMAQRAELIGGIFSLRSNPGGGTLINVTLPLSKITAESTPS